MNITLLKNTLKKSWKLLFIFLVVICFYLSVIISLIDPADIGKIKELFGTMGSLLDAFHISIDAMTSPLAYTASTFFGLLVMAFIMVFYLIQSYSLIAKPVEDTSISYILSTPVTRTQLVVTQGIYLILSLLVLFLDILATGALMLRTKGSYDFAAYCNLVGVTFLLCTAVAMLSFFLSTAFCGTRLAAGLGTGVPIGLLVISMIGSAGGEKLDWLEKLSPFSWIDSVGIVNGESNTLWMYLAFSAAILALLAASAAVFRQRRLPV